MNNNEQDRVVRAILSVDRVALGHELKELSERLDPLYILQDVISPALTRIGEGWYRGEVSLSQVYMSGRMCEEIVDKLLPAETRESRKQPRIAICVFEDFHTLGKKMVKALLRSSGFELIDYGNGVKAADLGDAIERDGIEIMLISTLMLSSALKVRELKNILLKKGLGSVRIVVGGAPFLFDGNLWKDVGADTMGRYASEAISIIEGMMRERRVSNL